MDTHQKPLHIFKPGRYTAMSGTTLDFTAADLAAAAAAYHPAKFEAPLVVGHPQVDEPAFGWVKALAATPDLEAVPHQVDAAFAAMVSAGRFKKISASFFMPDAPGNPVPGVYYLRHVGFLGAAAPAVSGLRTPTFAAAAAASDIETIEFATEFSTEPPDPSFAAKAAPTTDPAVGAALAANNTVAPTTDPAVGAALAANNTVPPAPSEFATQFATEFPTPTEETPAVTPEQKAALEAENAQLKAQITAAAEREKTALSARRHADHASFCAALVTEGRLLPGLAPVMVQTLDFVAAQEQVVEFAAADGSKSPLASALQDALKTVPKLIDFAEHSADNASGRRAASADFALPAGMTVDTSALNLHHQASDYAVAHKVPYATAVRAVAQAAQ